jgi:hypothetical protein
MIDYDFIVESGRSTVAVEVKAAARFDERDLSGLRAFLARAPECRAAILAYGGETSAQLGDRLFAMPHAALLG